MKLFRDYTFSWQQATLFKIYIVSFGLLVGAHFPEVVMQYKNLLIGIFVVLLVYFVHAIVTKKI